MEVLLNRGKEKGRNIFWVFSRGGKWCYQLCNVSIACVFHVNVVKPFFKWGSLYICFIDIRPSILIYLIFWKNTTFLHIFWKNILFQYKILGNSGKVYLWLGVHQSLDYCDSPWNVLGYRKLCVKNRWINLFFLDYRNIINREAGRHPAWIHYEPCII